MQISIIKPAKESLYCEFLRRERKMKKKSGKKIMENEKEKQQKS